MPTAGEAALPERHITGSTMRLALVQMTALASPEDNADLLRDLLATPEASNADCVALPEVCNMVQQHPARAAQCVHSQEDDPVVALLCTQARQQRQWILAGSVVIREPQDAGRLRNRSLLIDASGSVVAFYDKIHMFDVTLGPEESYRESASFAAGDTAVAVAGTPWGTLGLSICYDLRNPGLYRTLTHMGAQILCVPAAFTVSTGQAQWHALLRARAIENACFVIAPAQTGTHEDSRRTFGHSLVVDPWGGVLFEGGTAQGVELVTLNLEAVRQARDTIPAWSHGSAFKTRTVRVSPRHES